MRLLARLLVVVLFGAAASAPALSSAEIPHGKPSQEQATVDRSERRLFAAFGPAASSETGAAPGTSLEGKHEYPSGDAAPVCVDHAPR